VLAAVRDSQTSQSAPRISRQALVRVPKNGDTASVLATSGGLSGVAIGSDGVYWTDSKEGTVNRVALEGGQPETLASGQSQIQGVLVDSQGVYWATWVTNGEILKLPR